jgi:hypothetical protein
VLSASAAMVAYSTVVRGLCESFLGARMALAVIRIMSGISLFTSRQ